MAKKSGEMTPLMKQYWDIKTAHQDKILLFRMGDFFEIFHDDAVKAAPIVGITLTQRNKKSEDQTPMCGVPHHAIGAPINKLLAAGLKIAICDQVEDPKLAKGLVKRAVTRILTPGMVFDSETLDQTKAHYLCGLDSTSISFVDTTTGEAFYFETSSDTEKLRLIDILPVAEVVVRNKNEKWILDHNLSDRVLVSEHAVPDLTSRELLLSYIKTLAVTDLQFLLKPFEKRETEQRLNLSQTTLRHLEIFSNYKGLEQGSLFKAIDRTKTSAGSRLLRQWLSFPLRNKTQITQRQEQISCFRDHMMELKKVREILAGMGDLERRMGKVSQPQCHARDLLAIGISIKVGLQALTWSKKFHDTKLEIDLPILSELAAKIEATIADDAPLSVKQGHMIKCGVLHELDDLINLSVNAHQLVQALEQKEKTSTGISSLKVRYNNVFGYYIEITNAHKDKAPKHYQRKQTLANAERYYTDELIELEKKVLSAQSKRFELEYEIYSELRNEILAGAARILNFASCCNELDVISSLAWLSLEESYCRPTFDEAAGKLYLKSSRHAVVEQFARGKFTSNTVLMEKRNCFLITGPNMAGKSTLMRQVALSVILAQMGSYVPATEAVLPIYDAVFTRIGASDQLSEGLSTFMVEMTETAAMLNEASPNSLLILDEVGRGTATFDGMCLAQSILEYILTHLKTHVLFATHYHELTLLEKKFLQIKTKFMQVETKSNGDIQFLHLLTDGSAGQSYGVKVAELAGIPKEIIKRAHDLLQELESAKVSSSSADKKDFEIKSTKQMALFETVLVVDHEKEKLISELKTYPVQKSSPLEALNQIAKWQQKI